MCHKYQAELANNAFRLADYLCGTCFRQVQVCSGGVGSQHHSVARSGAGFPLFCRGAGANQRAIAGECVTDHRAGCNDDIRPVGSGHSPFAACRVVSYAVAGFELCHFGCLLFMILWPVEPVLPPVSLWMGFALLPCFRATLFCRLILRERFFRAFDAIMSFHCCV